MPTPLLETKFYVPSSRRELVSRPRLIERLEHGAESKLTLVSAPAGFGKTTLLAEWLATRSAAMSGEPHAAWLSLDLADNDPSTFWTYVVAALRKAAPGVSASVLGLIHDPQPPPIEVILTELANDLGTVDTDLVLVLDDYHVIESREIQQAVAFLVDHLPHQLHLVVASRSDPALPLARLRARDELVEVRAADLRFTPAEASSFLTEAMGLPLTAYDVSALEERTEGWIAALQLAALSMRGRDDIAGFIAGFAGDDRYVVDYLVEEVVQRQPEQVQAFLLQTSILARLNGPLCDAVTEQVGGRTMLEALDRGNLFLIPLDDRRQWYRYHHLFADVLRTRLLDEQPDVIPELHRRASEWYAEEGESAIAIDHALAAQDFERAADLVELAMPAMSRDRGEATVRAWVERLPDDLVRTRPVLSNGFAGVLLSTGAVDGVATHLEDAARWLDPSADRTQFVVVDEEAFRRLPAGVAIHRAGLALVTGDLPAIVTHSQHALDLLDDDEHLGQAAGTALIGLALWWSGDLENALDAYTKSLRSMQRAGHIADVLGLSIALADMQTTLGALRDASRTYEGALDLTPKDGSVLRGTADMYVGLSALALERNELERARDFLTRSDDLGDHLGLRQNRYRWRVSMARLAEIEGRPAEAVELLDEAERMYAGDFSPNVRPVAAVRARTYINQGRLADAETWAEQVGVSPDDQLDYLREFEHITLARLLLAKHARERSAGFVEAADGLLERLLQSAETGKRTGSVIEILVLQARVWQLRGDIPGALVPLERALALADPEGYVRVFIDEGKPMALLLQAAADRGIRPEQVRQLLNHSGASVTPDEGATVVWALVDPLSDRELDVLRLLATELSGPEIARDLVVSLNTVRTHTKNIYAKLGVNNRRAAVRRAAEIGLLSRR